MSTAMILKLKPKKIFFNITVSFHCGLHAASFQGDNAAISQPRKLRARSSPTQEQAVNMQYLHQSPREH